MRVEESRVGLCFTCRHAQTIDSSRGSRFYLWERSRTDARFPRYPALPVVACIGWERRPEPPDEGGNDTGNSTGS
jgi:hypothetical protein